MAWCKACRTGPHKGAIQRRATRPRSLGIHPANPYVRDGQTQGQVGRGPFEAIRDYTTSVTAVKHGLTFAAIKGGAGQRVSGSDCPRPRPPFCGLGAHPLAFPSRPSPLTCKARAALRRTLRDMGCCQSPRAFAPPQPVTPVFPPRVSDGLASGPPRRGSPQECGGLSHVLSS